MTIDEIEQNIRTNVIAEADLDYLKSGAIFESKWELNVGRKFIKIFRISGGTKCVWGFVSIGEGEHKGVPYKQGDIFKAASFAAPAKHSRGNVLVPYKWKWTGPDYR